MAIAEAVAGLKEIRIADLDLSKAQALADEFQGQYRVVAMCDTKEAVTGADLVVTQTTSRKDFIKKEWLISNATVIQMEAHSFEPEVLLTADKIFLDNWAQMSHLDNITVAQLYKAGKLKKEDVVEMPDMVCKNHPARENDDEFIFCATAGVGAVDITIANQMYENAKKMGIGQKLMLWDNPLWV